MTANNKASQKAEAVRTVVAGICQNDGLILICQRRHDAMFPLKWEFPGGKVEPGESPRVALARELFEELGIEAQIGAEIYRTRHRYPELPFELELIFYAFTLKGSAAALRNQAFEQIAWLAPQALPTLDFLPADRELTSLLASGRLLLE